MQTYFEKTNAEMFTGGHYAYNLASGKLLKAAGFQYEGVEHKAMRHATRGATDPVCYYIEKRLIPCSRRKGSEEIYRKFIQ